MIELDVRRWEPHTLEATGTTLPEWCMFVRQLGGVALGDHHVRRNWIKALASFIPLAAFPAVAAARTGTFDSIDILVVMIVVVTILPAVVLCWYFWDSMEVEVRSGTNDDDEAAKTFISMFERAQEDLVIYDDGNKMDRTIYDDQNVTEAVRNHLKNNRNLVVRCLFNDEDDLELVQAMRTEYPDRFKVWYRRGARPQGDIHYKIVDKGTMGHISSHEHGQPERQFKLLDCTAAKPRTQRIALGRYLDRFEKEIKEQAFAAT